MYSFLIRRGPLVASLTALLLIIVGLIPIMSGSAALDALPEQEQAFAPEGDIFYPVLYITVALLVLAVAAAILLSLFNVLKNPKASIRGLIGFAVLVVLFFIFWTMSDAEATGSLKATIEQFNITPGVSKLIGASIRLTLFLGVASVVLMIVLEVWNFFKNQ